MKIKIEKNLLSININYIYKIYRKNLRRDSLKTIDSKGGINIYYICKIYKKKKLKRDSLKTVWQQKNKGQLIAPGTGLKFTFAYRQILRRLLRISWKKIRGRISRTKSIFFSSSRDHQSSRCRSRCFKSSRASHGILFPQR